MTQFFLIFSLFVSIVVSGIAQEKQELWLFNPKVKLDKDEFKKLWEHSGKTIAGRNKVNSEAYFTKADSVLNIYQKDSITVTELVKLYREAFDLFTWEDPHFRIYPQFIRHSDSKEATKKNYRKYIMALPFSLLQINDSLIIDKSASNELLKGDMIISINGVKAKDLLDYTYRDRYINSTMMQLQYHMMFSRNYDLKLVRNGRVINLNVAGVSLYDYDDLLTNNKVSQSLYEDIGYIEIERFNKNSHIISELRKLIKEVKNRGGHSVIIDLRKNVGGSGDDFDKLLSIFTSKEEIDYQKGVKVMISEKTIPHYGYADSIGKMINLPDSEIFKTIPLQPKLYMGEVDYYILTSINTGSMASTFVNIMQYNNLGILVGEPMRHNATRYGEIYEGNSAATRLIYSTAEYDELTKAVNGIIKPDIKIPYRAKEYMKGGDPLLEKLLKIIKSKNNGKVALE